MNRLTADGILQETRLGKRVVVISENHEQAYGAFREFLDRAQQTDIVTKALFTVGRNQVVLDRGQVRFTSLRSARNSLEGTQPHLVYIERVHDRMLLWKVYRDTLRRLEEGFGTEVLAE